MQLGDRPIFKLIDLPLEAADSQQVLQTLALEMMHQNQERLPKAAMIQLVEPRLKAVGATVEGEKFVELIAEVSELLVEPEKNEYEFAHLSFQAFLAANEIMQRNAEDFLVEKWQEDWWKDTMLFYAGSVKNPSSFLRKLLDKGEEAVSLADACRKNTSKKIDRSIEIQLRGIDSQIGKLRYEKLEGFLKNRQWKEADNETFRVMLEVLGKEKDDYFTREELLNFPCEDLLKIDGLWLQYSKINGVSKFGFSLQKEILKNCGYKLDGSDLPSEVWYDFLDKVGWRDKKTEEWSDPTYTLDANTKIGTLPLCWCFAVGGVGLAWGWRGKAWVACARGGYYLASRLMDCSR